MKKLIIFVSSFLIFSQINLYDQTLKILTFNVWSGLDYDGTFKMGEYETASKREKRFESMVTQIKGINPDMIFLQEANPVDEYTSRLSKLLDYNEVHQVCNAGFKIGSVGIPVNLKEGQIILARKSLNLEKYDAWKLSGSPGINSDFFNLHFNESIYTLVGKIKINNVSFYLLNVHLFAGLPNNKQLKTVLKNMLDSNKISEDEYYETLEKLQDGCDRQKKEVKRLISAMQDLPQNSPIIVAGDFNSDVHSNLISNFKKRASLIDTYIGEGKYLTWNPDRNNNIKISSLPAKDNSSFNAYDSLNEYYDLLPKKIDHIFLNKMFSAHDILYSNVVLDSSFSGIYSSDHFGYLSVINCDNALKNGDKESDDLQNFNDSEIEPLPIINYDADAGFGYGAKLFVLNKLKHNESFDALVFNSTKGERWYRFVFSIPDFELRQGKKYPFSLDLIVDYDKWINNSFFGIGNRSRDENKEFYTREPLEISLTLSRAFTESFVSQFGLKYKTVKNSNFSENGVLNKLQPSQNQGKSNSQSFYFNIRYDTRNGFINPSNGSVAQIEYEIAPGFSFTNTKYSKLSLLFQNYIIPFYPKTVLANRLMLQSIFGNGLPIQVLNSIGGNSTVRGFNQDRYLDKVSYVFNSELRFPIFWRFGGIFGFDAGNVCSSFSKISFQRTLVSGVFGLRFYMDTYVIRCDAGFSKESTGIYFNFGQIF